MIRLTRINHVPVVLNADLIQSVESTPDTVICLTSGAKVIVRETPDEVVHRVMEYRRALQQHDLPHDGKGEPTP